MCGEIYLRRAASRKNQAAGFPSAFFYAVPINVNAIF